MKKYLLLALIGIFPMVAISQLNYGVKAGTTLSWYRSSTDEGIVPEYSTLAGFQAGVFAEAKLNSYFSVQPELLFSSRGAKSAFSETFAVPTSTGYTNVDVKLKLTMTPLYLDLPVYLKAGFPSVGTDRFTIGVGPVFSYGVGGKAKIKGSVGDESVSEKIKLFSEDDFDLEGGESEYTLLNRFDVAAAGFVAYEFNNLIVLSLNYQYGLKNISEDPDEDLRNRSVSITLGYKF
jgi:hypothetical protein